MEQVKSAEKSPIIALTSGKGAKQLNGIANEIVTLPDAPQSSDCLNADSQRRSAYNCWPIIWQSSSGWSVMSINRGIANARGA